MELMACFVVKDPDDTWHVDIDWSDWFDDKIAIHGGTFTVTDSVWTIDAAVTEEGKNLDDTSKIMSFYGSGGVVDTDYDIQDQISYTSSVLSGQTFKETRTMEIRIREK